MACVTFVPLRSRTTKLGIALSWSIPASVTFVRSSLSSHSLVSPAQVLESCIADRSTGESQVLELFELDEIRQAGVGDSAPLETEPAQIDQISNMSEASVGDRLGR